MKICSTYCNLSIMEKKTIIWQLSTQKTKMHIAFQFTKNYDLQVNEKNNLKPYLNLMKKKY